MKRSLAYLTAALLALGVTGSVTGCGAGSTGPVRDGGPASGLREPGGGSQYAQLYFVSTRGLQSVARQTSTAARPQQALDLLLEGPDSAERARGLTTDLPPSYERVFAQAGKGTVDVHLPVAVADMHSGTLGLNQIVCTAANARVPGGKRPPDVTVRVHEPGIKGVWSVHCDATGSIVPILDR
ncbi:hypothetical protein AB0A77_30520 [Streptomyces varsoviensis]|uniref:GerMN domain-containing protein n=1 Tax=Streptomyces varsoviensis TaxID=67373 RepID=UPI0033C64B39